MSLENTFLFGLLFTSNKDISLYGSSKGFNLLLFLKGIVVSFWKLFLELKNDNKLLFLLIFDVCN